MDKFQNKYRISSARLQNWDYGWNSAYFITVCTANRECFFGNIVNGKMKLSKIGELANNFLIEIPQRYEYAILDEHIVMPNHVHAIVIIDKIDDGRGGNCGDGRGGIGRDAINRVSTNTTNTTNTITGTDSKFPIKPPGDQTTLKKTGGITGDKNPMLHDNISRIFNWFTGRVTFESRKIDKNFAW